MVAGLRPRGLTAARTCAGPLTAALFEDWVETCLVPTLSPGEIVVMDNLPAHKGPRVKQLIEAAGAELRYLPAYSPDMNPIERAFSKLKAFLRKIAERTVAGLLRALETCAEIFKPSECTNNFKSCGYQDYTGGSDSACLMTFRAEKARRNRWERVAALSSAARVGSGVR